ncbi:hypothetical protein MBLNU457_5215t2 [Dothideomycetes sp. NU457]
MASRPERVHHQDYIARVRYSNTLPPPPNPPKLLDIPGTGLSSGLYTSAAFASRLAREQPLNIEADAELGMPIDLVGIPGVFDGNEEAIMTRDPVPPVHPHDRALLRPLAALGKSAASSSGVSFLRRTEYISSNQGQGRFESSTSHDLLRLRNDPKRKRKQEVENKQDPNTMLRYVVKGFDIAYPHDVRKGPDSKEDNKVKGAAITDADVKAWANPKHPTNPSLQLLDSYPVLPDLDAVQERSLAFIVMRFNSNPSGMTDKYDPCLDVAMLKPININEERHEDRMAAYEADLNLTQPAPEYDYELYMPENRQYVHGMKRKFDVKDPDNDDPSLYSHDEADGSKSFRYNKIRTYETYQQAGDAENHYADTVALALHDPELDVGASRLKKGAYFYPIMQRTNIRQKRKVAGYHGEEEETADIMGITVRDPLESELKGRQLAKSVLDPTVPVPEDAESLDGPA